MKRTAFFLLMLFTYYMATMYYSRQLLGFFLAEALLTLGMWALSLYLRRHITAESSEKSIVGEPGDDLSWHFRLNNTGLLPLPRIRLPLRFHYGQEAHQGRRILSCILEGKDGKVCCSIHAPYCGILYLETRRLLVYDYLGLFPGKIPFSHIVTVAILPPRQPLSIEFSASGPEETSPDRGFPSSRRADDSQELLQLHEYRPGDSCRHIHWNQSARTDRLWIREFEKEREADSVSLLLKIDSHQRRDLKRMDAFYRILSAIVLGLLRTVSTVKVYQCAERSGQTAEWVVTEESQCRELLLDLYRLNPSEPSRGVLFRRTGSEKPDSSRFQKHPFESVNEPSTGQDVPEGIDSVCFRLNSDLAWYLGDRLIHRFSEETLNQEIAERVFSISCKSITPPQAAGHGN